jgi:hypothetical protein
MTTMAVWIYLSAMAAALPSDLISSTGTTELATDG